MELLVTPEILTSYIYIYMDLHLATLKAVSFYLLHSVSTLNQCRKLSCGTIVCKHFARYQDYPNYRCDLTLSLLMSYIYGAPCKARNFSVVYISIYIHMDLRLATLKAVSLYLLHNVSTLNQCRKLSCDTVVCKHFASYQGYAAVVFLIMGANNTRNM
jgi:hypothetical protein